MKKIGVLLILIMLCVLFGCDKKLPVVEKIFEINANVKTIDIEEINGDISIKKSDKEYSYIKYSENEENYILKIEYDEDNNDLEIEREDTRDFITKNKKIESIVELYLATDNLIIEIDVDNGNVIVSDVNATSIDIETDNGNISISKYNGELTTETVNGKTEASDVEAKQFKLNGSNGNIKIENIKIAERLTLITKNSEIEIKDSAFEKCYVENMNGKVNLQKLEISTKLEVKVNTGEINLSLLGKRADYTVNASSKAGKVAAESGVGKIEIKLNTEIGNINVSYGE